MRYEAVAETVPATDRLSIREEVLRFGEGGRLFGVLTVPGPVASDDPLPIFVFLNAGLLHRVGPRRLHVDAARLLARLGFPSLRIDQSGIGDSPVRIGATGVAQQNADLVDLLTALRSRMGQRPIVAAGLCAGADSAIALTLIEGADVAGLILLDPVCYPDRGFAARRLLRAVWERVAHPVYHARLFVRHVGMFLNGHRPVDQLSLRDCPTIEQTRSAFDRVQARGGKILSVFTRYSLIYYNRRGQFAEVLGGERSRGLTELFWPEVNHVFPLQVHRARLIERIEDFATHYLRRNTVADSGRR